MICITFDTDYITNDTLDKFIKMYINEIPGASTFFIHKNFPELFNQNCEICPHPFINNLEKWDTDLRNLEFCFDKKPKGLRTHSCVFSHMIGIDLNNKGYKWISQAQNLFSTNLYPFRHPWGIWELPIYYMDNMDFWMTKNWKNENHKPFDQKIIDKCLNNEGLYVFDFHPIHIALNTRNFNDYQRVKERITSNKENPFNLTYSGVGCRDFFERLCETLQISNKKSLTCSNALNLFYKT